MLFSINGYAENYDSLLITKSLGKGEYLVKYKDGKDQQYGKIESCIFKNEVVIAYDPSKTNTQESSEKYIKISKLKVGDVFYGTYSCFSKNNDINQYFCSFKGYNENELLIFFSPKEESARWRTCFL